MSWSTPISMEIFISYPETERLCPVCGSRDCVIKDSSHSLTVRHIAAHHPVSDSLDVYHMVRENQAATRDIPQIEREMYLKDYIGWRDDTPDDGDFFP